MKRTEFFNALAEALEFNQELNAETVLKELENYDSMSVLAIIALVDENFSKKLTAAQLNSITTVKSLMELIGIERFED